MGNHRNEGKSHQGEAKEGIRETIDTKDNRNQGHNERKEEGKKERQ